MIFARRETAGKSIGFSFAVGGKRPAGAGKILQKQGKQNGRIGLAVSKGDYFLLLLLHKK